MKINDDTRLNHILDACREAISFLGNRSLEELMNDRMVLHAVVRSLEIIGEASAQLSETFRAAHAEVPWQKIIGMRNRIVHAYFDIDCEVVWSTVHNDLPGLLQQIEKIAGSK
jgi:uncharacterized protein with HEPN domain